MNDPINESMEKAGTNIFNLEILSEISRIAQSPLNLKERLNTIVNRTAERLGADCCYISLLDKDDKHLILKATKGLNLRAVNKVMLNIGEGINGWVALEKKVVALRDAHLDPRYKYVSATGEEKFRSLLAVPVTFNERCIGVLTVQTIEPKDFSENEITLLATIAREVGCIIRNAQLYESINHRLLELTTIHEVGQALTSTLDLETLLRLIIKNTVWVTKSRGGVLRLLDLELNKLVVKAYSMPEDDIIGTITLYDKVPEAEEEFDTFTNEDLQLLLTLASQASIAIENAKLYQQTLKNAREMETLFSLSKGLTSILDLHFVLDSILRMTCELLDGGFGILTLYDEHSRELITKSVYGVSSTIIPQLKFKLGEGITGWIGEHKESIMIGPVVEGDKKREFVEIKNLIGVPLMVKDRLIGTIEIANKVSAPKFSSSDLMFLSTFAGQAAIAIENANLYEKAKQLAEENLKKATELSILHEISSTLATTLDLDRLLHIILTGVTIGGGLGFNRAILFLLDEKEDFLKGVLGVGPDSGEEAQRMWNKQPSSGSLRERILSDDDMSIHKHSKINKLATSLRVPINGGTSVLARTVLDKRGYIISDALNDPRTLPSLRDTIKTESFATAPLIAKGKVIGVIFVDNHFTRKPITEDDMRFLMMFANQVGLAIENAMIYSNLEVTNKSLREAQERLIQQERMAALGEMATSIAHEIRNPLVSIGGFARRLKDKLASDEQSKRYSEIIYQEVNRLERILQEILAFAKEGTPRFVTTDINKIIEDVLVLFRDGLTAKNIKVITEFSKEMPLISTDSQQLKQVFINLIANAEQAMEENGGILSITTRISDELPPEIHIEISNTGPGIPHDIMANIFNPFFTTKSSGTGLGLAIVHRIINSHNGSISVNNRPDRSEERRV